MHAQLPRIAATVVAALMVCGCVSTSIQGYADRELPAGGKLQHLAAYIAAPGPLASSMQSSVAEEAKKRGLVAEDVLSILPPTRRYTDAEVRRALSERRVDGILIITVADTGVVAQYAGTIFQSSSSGVITAEGTATRFGNSTDVSATGNYSGTTVGTSTPTYRYSRRTAFSAKLVEPSSARNLWVGNGEVDAGGGKGLVGRLIVSNGVSSSNSVRAIFDDLEKNGLI